MRTEQDKMGHAHRMHRRGELLDLIESGVTPVEREIIDLELAEIDKSEKRRMLAIRLILVSNPALLEDD